MQNWIKLSGWHVMILNIKLRILLLAKSFDIWIEERPKKS